MRQGLTLHLLGGDRTSLYEPMTQKILTQFLDGRELTSGILDELPYIRASEWGEPPFHLSISLITRFRSDVSKFFQEMISKWLMPGRSIPLDSFMCVRVCFSEWGENDYVFAEAVLEVGTVKGAEIIQRNYETVEREIKLGLRSRFHAKRLLEIKGISNSEKTILIQEKISHLVGRFPEMFDYDIFGLMQRYLVSVSDGYLQARSHRLITKIICTIYRFQHELAFQVEQAPKKRHLLLRLARTQAQTPFGLKSVLGFFIGLNFLKENEVFDKRHLQKAVERFSPRVKVIEESYFAREKESEKTLAFYVEMEKEGEIPFTDQEVNRLRLELKGHLQGCIESLVRPIFMPRNEEEVLKYIVTLSAQIDVIHDIPQIVIIFDEQTDRDLFFTVVLARIVLPDSPRIEEVFLESNPMIDVTIERVRQLGFVQKKFPKEIAVLRIRLSNASFLRDDFAVDLYRARQQLVHILKERIGEVRDYNGGMISKQMEVFTSFKELLAIESNEYMAENFFHALYPVEQRGVIHLKYLQPLYQLFAELRLDEDEERSATSEECVYWCSKFYDVKRAKETLDEVMRMQIPTPQLMRLFLPIQDLTYLGFIFFSDSNDQQQIFLDVLKQVTKYT